MKKANTIKIIFFMVLCCFLSCEHEKEKFDDYLIMSEILNKSYGNESDLENGLGWIDDSLTYNSILLLNHTRLKSWDMKLIREYIDNSDLSKFEIKDFQANRILEIENIKGFNRYNIQELKDQEIKSGYIGIIQFSAVSFNKTHNEALIYTSFICAGNGDCGIGIIYHLVKNDKWEIINEEELWVA